MAVLKAKFLNSCGILCQFTEVAKTQLFVLPALGGVAVGNCTQGSLFEVGYVTIEAYTTDGNVASAANMGGMIN